MLLQVTVVMDSAAGSGDGRHVRYRCVRYMAVRRRSRREPPRLTLSDKLRRGESRRRRPRVAGLRELLPQQQLVDGEALCKATFDDVAVVHGRLRTRRCCGSRRPQIPRGSGGRAGFSFEFLQLARNAVSRHFIAALAVVGAEHNDE
jgi:hypothetical protein